MSDNKKITEKWEQFRPSKTLWLWSCAGAIVVALLLGFTVGGWVTGGTAQGMAQSAREHGRAELAAAVCVDRFLQSPEFSANLAALEKEDSWARDNYVADGGWVTLADMEAPVDGAAQICADALLEMKATGEGSTTAVDTTKS